MRTLKELNNCTFKPILGTNLDKKSFEISPVTQNKELYKRLYEEQKIKENCLR